MSSSSIGSGIGSGSGWCSGCVDRGWRNDGNVRLWEDGYVGVRRLGGGIVLWGDDEMTGW